VLPVCGIASLNQPHLLHLPLHPDFLQTHRVSCKPRQFEIKAFLESVHGMQVERVSTINYQGKKERIYDSTGRVHYR
jgi:hypothetical protein